jgi:hypothetical protein
MFNKSPDHEGVGVADVLPHTTKISATDSDNNTVFIFLLFLMKYIITFENSHAFSEIVVE